MQIATLKKFNIFILVQLSLFSWQCYLVLNQSDVDFIKKSKYITERILGVIFWSGNLLPFTLTCELILAKGMGLASISYQIILNFGPKL